MALIIWTDWNSERFAFCTRLCLEMYRRYLGDPTMRHLLPVFMATFSCWWCGTDLAEAVAAYADDPGAATLQDEQGDELFA